ncbi:hypothetical protein ACRARG_11915 [Pseudooceanicola sp. C21-150M6]|uniref:hypothetical protein n=1 Tax=Pseudooceanicola sp. C21-150M6 TaxID=3434355 RepID=UPI003D7FA38E
MDLRLILGLALAVQIAVLAIRYTNVSKRISRFTKDLEDRGLVHRQQIDRLDPALFAPGTPATEHRVPLAVRLLTIAICGVILLRAAQVAVEQPGTWTWGLMLVPALAYVAAYLWQFTVRIEGRTISVMTLGFRTQEYRLDRLVQLHDDGIPAYRLRFEGGKTALVLKYVHGHSLMRRALDEALATR